MNKQSTKIISNYLVGVIMSLIRNTDQVFYWLSNQYSEYNICFQHEVARINQLIVLLGEILPNVHGINLKQLKNTLRNEQCDNAFFVTTSKNSVKKVTCFGPVTGLKPT